MKEYEQGLVYPDGSFLSQREIIAKNTSEVQPLFDVEIPPTPDPDWFAEIARQRQKQMEAIQPQFFYTRIVYETDKPILLCCQGDTHLGAREMDVDKFEEDRKAILNTPNAKVALFGDITDNIWFAGGAYEQTNEPEFQQQWATQIVKEYYDKGKLAFALPGEHTEFWQYKETGLSAYRNMQRIIGNFPFLISPARAEIVVGNQMYKLGVAHRFKGHSIYTKSHPARRLERDRFWGADIFLTAHCFDENVELLTKEGWKKRQDIYKGTKVLTYNKSSKILEWQKVIKKYEYKHFKELLHFKTKQINIKVTKGHTLLYKQAKVGHSPNETKHCDLKYKAKEANYVLNLKGGIIFPKAGFIKNKGVDLSNDWLRLIAWLIADGHFRKNGATQLFQTHGKKRDRIIKMLNRLNIPFSIYERDNRGRTFYDKKANKKYQYKKKFSTFYITIKNSKKIRKYINSKSFPKFLYRMNQKQFEIFWETIVDGDGYKRSETAGSYYSVNLDLINDLQALLVQHGYRSILKEKDKYHNQYTLYYCKKDWVQTNNPSNYTKIVPYDGIAWCVSVPNKTLVVRSNGKTLITGNTHEREIDQAEVEGFDGKRDVIYGVVGTYKRGDRYQNKVANRTGQMGGIALLLLPDRHQIIGFKDIVEGIEFFKRV